MVTFNVLDFKPQYEFLEDMPVGAVLDYLMGQCCFSGLEQTVINGKSFIDGGVVDNMPMNGPGQGLPEYYRRGYIRDGNQ